MTEKIEPEALSRDEIPAGHGERVTLGRPKRWGDPLERFDRVWTRVEVRLCLWVLLTEVVAIFLYISFKGLAAAKGNPAGPTYRAILTAAVLALVAHLATRPKKGAPPTNVHRAAVAAALFGGIFAGRLWDGKGAEYFSNILDWIESSSGFFLIGGLKGMITRLTLWVALLGASLATSQGKHINIDIVLRVVPPRLRLPVALVGWISSAVVCFTAAVGFSDYLAVREFQAPTVPCAAPGGVCDAPASAKAAKVKSEIVTDLFLLRRQISLDLRTLPKVLSGKKYDGWMTAAEWNAWMKESDWVSAYAPLLGEEAARKSFERRLLPPDLQGTQVPRVPLLTQGVGLGLERRLDGALVRELNFVFPVGFFFIALRFVLRILLALSGHVRIDPDAAHDGEPKPQDEPRKEGV